MRAPFLVSNRLPVRITVENGRVDTVPSAGGLATALRGFLTEAQARWLGWPGDVAEGDRPQVTAALAELQALPVFLSEQESRGFYEHFSNQVLWPLLHCEIDKLPLDEHFRSYHAVNRRFAEQILMHTAPDDPVWVHDFHLALVPAELRRRRPESLVGFFLHVPFPPVDVFRVLPWRRELLMGILGADLVGFQTERDVENFKDCVARLTGGRVNGARVELAGNTAQLGAFPIGIDMERFENAARTPEVQARAQALRDEAHGRRIILGVDRLDYTKGIPRRLLAVEKLLERWPELAPAVHFVQVAVPSRETVDAYADLRSRVNELVGRVNGKHGTATGVPIHFLYREVPFEELVALYVAADVMLVTPQRDGMNLVCKEYVATHTDERGVLILSELAGAAAELDGALIVNPYDVDAVARRLQQALIMPADEQRARMAGMRHHLRGHGVKEWAKSFLFGLEDASTRRRDHPIHDELTRAARAPRLHLVLDYDGTLVPIEATPSQATLDDELRALLAELAAAPATDVHIVSGRDAKNLEEWFGDAPVTLYAEHGAHMRAPGGIWQMADPPAWKADAIHALSAVAEQAPGAFVEVKHCSVALHGRCAAREQQSVLLRAGGAVLERLRAKDSGMTVLFGDLVVEVRCAAYHKGTVVERIVHERGDVIFAAGDDATDDDLFSALPVGSVAVAVGPRPKRAKWRVGDIYELRAILARLAAARGHRG